ncbi:MAG: type II toxin-antitoxin system death-on-curing family toxin [Pseudonocardiales bacterium]
MNVGYLTLEDAFELIRRLGAGPVRDVGLLDSALHRPQSALFGQDAYPSIELKAAALLHSLARNHPLVDGNKRLAWLATVVFLDINGYRCDLSRAEAVQLVLEVAKGDLDVHEIAEQLAARPMV